MTYKKYILAMVCGAALGMGADTGLVAKALCSMSVQPGPQATPIFILQF